MGKETSPSFLFPTLFTKSDWKKRGMNWMHFESIRVKKSVFLNKNRKYYVYKHVFPEWEWSAWEADSDNCIITQDIFRLSLEILFSAIATFFFLIPLVVINLPLKVNLVFNKSSLHIENRLCYKCSFLSQLLGTHPCPETLARGIRQLWVFGRGSEGCRCPEARAEAGGQEGDCNSSWI